MRQKKTETWTPKKQNSLRGSYLGMSVQTNTLPRAEHVMHNGFIPKSEEH